jgi:uncharacterized protein (TIGR02147 family)
MREHLSELEPRSLLQSELADRCENNPSYSLRAFAKAIGMDHSVLSRVLSGKRPLSKKAALKVAEILGLDPLQKKALLDNRTFKNREKNEESIKLPQYQQITLDVFSLLSDWYHYGILSLLDIPKTKFEARWIAKKLGISQIQAKMAMDRLKRLNLIHKQNGKWLQSGQHFKVENTISTGATRKYHEQILNKAIESLKNDPIEVRDFSAMTMAIDPKMIPYAIERIRSFRRKLMQDLESKSSPKAVYNLAVQIYPVSKFPNKPKQKRRKKS